MYSQYKNDKREITKLQLKLLTKRYCIPNMKKRIKKKLLDILVCKPLPGWSTEYSDCHLDFSKHYTLILSFLQKFWRYVIEFMLAIWYWRNLMNVTGLNVWHFK